MVSIDLHCKILFHFKFKCALLLLHVCTCDFGVKEEN